MNSDQPAIGYGFHPFTVHPPEGLSLREGTRDQAFLHATLSSTPQSVEVRSPLDTRRVWTLDLIEPGQIDGLAADAPEHAIVGDTLFAFFAPTYHNRPVCQAARVVDARSLTPEICRAHGLSDAAGLVEVDAEAFGVCRYEVTLPEAKGGDGVTHLQHMLVGRFPDAEAAAAAPSDDTSTPSFWTILAWVLLAQLIVIPLQLLVLPWVRRRQGS